MGVWEVIKGIVKTYEIWADSLIRLVFYDFYLESVLNDLALKKKYNSEFN